MKLLLIAVFSFIALKGLVDAQTTDTLPRLVSTNNKCN